MSSENENVNLSEEMNINADENISGTEHLNDPITESNEDLSAIEKLQAELAEGKDKYIRLAAEFDNFRKRTAKERIELFQTAGKEIITELLAVLDDIERAEQQAEGVSEGISLIFNKVKATLQAKGLKLMETISTEFNPDLHDAITEIAAPTPDLVGKVVDEVQKGYYLNDKIIRHAKVVVGK